MIHRVGAEGAEGERGGLTRARCFYARRARSKENLLLLIARRAGPQVTALTAVRALWEDPRLDQLYRWDPRIPGYRLRRPGPAN